MQQIPSSIPTPPTPQLPIPPGARWHVLRFVLLRATGLALLAGIALALAAGLLAYGLASGLGSSHPGEEFAPVFFAVFFGAIALGLFFGLADGVVLAFALPFVLSGRYTRARMALIASTLSSLLAVGFAMASQSWRVASIPFVVAFVFVPWLLFLWIGNNALRSPR